MDKVIETYEMNCDLIPTPTRVETWSTAHSVSGIIAASAATVSFFVQLEPLLSFLNMMQHLPRRGLKRQASPSTNQDARALPETCKD